MRQLKREPATPLLLRQASGPAATRVVEATASPHPELASAAGRSGAVVLWLGDVAVADAVPVAAAVIVVEGEVADLVGVVLPAGWRDHGLGARLSREVLAACRARGCRRLVAAGGRSEGTASAEFRSMLTAGLTLHRDAEPFEL